MAYGFNEDRSKAPVYTQAEIDAMDLVNDEALAQEIADRQAAVTTEAGVRFAGDNALNTRLNNIVANAGDGTIPSELVDVRAEFNGRTKSTAGDSVRDQIEYTIDIAEHLSDKHVYYDFNIGQNIPLSGYSIGDIVELTPEESASTANWGYIITDCSGGDKFLITGNGGDSPRLFAVLDNQNRLLWIAARGAIENKYSIAIPNNGARFVMNSNFTLAPHSICAKIPKEENDSFYAPYEEIPLDQGYLYEIGATGTTIDINAKIWGHNYFSAIIDCSESDAFYITGQQREGSQNYSFAFVDENYQSIYSGRSNSYRYNVEEAPIGAKYLIVSRFKVSTIDVKVFKISPNVSTNSYFLKTFNSRSQTQSDISKIGNINHVDVTRLGTRQPGELRQILSFDDNNEPISKHLPFSEQGINVFDTDQHGPMLMTGFQTPRHLIAGNVIRIKGVGTGSLMQSLGDHIIHSSDNRLRIASTWNNDQHTTFYGNPIPYSEDAIYIMNDVLYIYDKESDYIIPAKFLDNANSKDYQKYMPTQSPEHDLAAVINGSIFADQLNDTIADFKKPGDLMVHVSTIAVINDVMYCTYYANTTTSSEDPSHHIARFAYAPLSDLSNITFFDLQAAGDTYDGQTITALYDTIFLRKDDSTLYLMWTAAINGEYYRLYQTYDIAAGTFGPILKNQFKVGNDEGDFNVSNIVAYLENNNIKYKPLFSDIGIMQKLTSRVENGVTYYYTGCYCGNFNCIIKSSDLITWEYVSAPSFENASRWENACYVIGDWCYYSVRQEEDTNTGFLARYNLNTNKWSDPVFYSDCHSRPDFFVWDNRLYMVYAPIDRNHIAIMEVNQTSLNRSKLVQIAKIPDYFYPFVTVYDNELYMSFTASRRHIYVSKFTLQRYSNDQVIAALKSLMQSIYN